MTQRDFADNCMRFLYVVAGQVHISDNAPLPFYNFWKQLVGTYDMTMAYEQLLEIAGRRSQHEHTMQQLLDWYAKHPAAGAAQCDQILGGKQVPKFFDTLLAAGYRAETERCKTEIRQFLKQQLDQF